MKYLLTAILIGGVIYYVFFFDGVSKKESDSFLTKDQNERIQENKELRDDAGMKSYMDALKESQENVKNRINYVIE